jgi:hypothetical protein
MIPKEINKRLEVLENLITPEDLPDIWISVLGGKNPNKGWRIGDYTILRKPGEDDEALRDRVEAEMKRLHVKGIPQLIIAVI